MTKPKQVAIGIGVRFQLENRFVAPEGFSAPIRFPKGKRAYDELVELGLLTPAREGKKRKAKRGKRKGHGRASGD